MAVVLHHAEPRGDVGADALGIVDARVLGVEVRVRLREHVPEVHDVRADVDVRGHEVLDLGERAPEVREVRTHVDVGGHEGLEGDEPLDVLDDLLLQIRGEVGLASELPTDVVGKSANLDMHPLSIRWTFLFRRAVGLLAVTRIRMLALTRR